MYEILTTLNWLSVYNTSLCKQCLSHYCSTICTKQRNRQAVILRNLQIDQVISTNQWRIQDFPLIWPFPSKNCVKLKIIGRRPNVSSSPGSVNTSIILTCSIRCQLLIFAIFFHLNCLSLNINHFKIFFPFVQVYAHISCESTKFIKTSSSLL